MADGQAIEMKPCPFCGSRIPGGRTSCSKLLGFERDLSGGLEVCCDGFGWYWVNCMRDDDVSMKGVYECCRGPKVKGPANEFKNSDKVRDAAKRAVEAWNRRVGQQTEQASLF